MKKLIAILAVMIVLAGAVFAADNDKLVLNSSVAKVVPNFAIYSKTTTVTGTAAGFDVETSKDISEESIDWSFTVKQFGDKRVTDEAVLDYAKFKGSIRLYVTINPFKARLTGATADTVQSTPYTITSAAPGAGYTDSANKARLAIAAGDGTANASAIDADAHVATFTLTYNGQKVIDTNAGTIATVAATWTKDEDLPMEGDGTTYKADVVLTYETV